MKRPKRTTRKDKGPMPTQVPVALVSRPARFAAGSDDDLDGPAGAGRRVRLPVGPPSLAGAAAIGAPTDVQPTIDDAALGDRPSDAFDLRNSYAGC